MEPITKKPRLETADVDNQNAGSKECKLGPSIVDPRPKSQLGNENLLKHLDNDDEDVAIVFVKRDPEAVIRNMLVRVVIGNYVQCALRGAVQDLLPDAAYFQNGLIPVINEYTIVVPDGIETLAAHSVLLTALNPGVPLNWKSTAKSMTVDQLHMAASYFNISADKLGKALARVSESESDGEDNNAQLSGDAPTKPYNEIQDQFHSYSQTADFLDLPFGQILTLLRKGFLAVQSEKEVYQAVMEWCNHRYPARWKERILAPLLAEIRWDLITDTLQQGISASDNPLRKVLSELKEAVMLKSRRQVTAAPRQRHFAETVYVFHADRNQVSLRRFDWRNNTLSDDITLKGLTASSTCKELGPAIGNKLCFRVQRGDKLQTFQYCPITKKVRILYDEPLDMLGLGPTVYLNGLLYRWDFENGQKKNNSCTFDLVSKATVKGLRLPKVLRKEAAFDCYDDKLYYCGGMPISEKAHPEAVSTVDMYDATTGQWTALPSMLFARRCFAVKVFNGYLYATGGACNSNKTFPYAILHTCERLKLNSPNAKWQRVADLQYWRYQHAMFVVDDRLYVCGGRLRSEQGFAMERYDVEGNKWDKLLKADRYLFGAISQCVTITQCFKG
ncbi:kelch-like protein 17 [Paramacrobiotus metropolitanus]|uniref:kelch-like protein 17 n=1 Tax=Paramacrobiotus metropolitanus TaxID=2943436 RepID=UPI0024462584|nr:kelch-like protein 17 [Paramacrobiotus metropolitanus]